MITKIQTPSAVNAYRLFPQEGSGTQTDPFDWYAKANVVEAVSSVTVDAGGGFSMIEAWLVVKLTAEETYTFGISGLSEMETTVTIYPPSGSPVSSVFDWETGWSLVYEAPTTGIYTIKVLGFSYGDPAIINVTPLPTEIAPWIEKADGVFESTGFDLFGNAEKKHSLREQRLLLPNDMYVAGYNATSQLGMGNTTNLGVFTLNLNAPAFKIVSNKGSKATAIDQYGYFWAWGDYEYPGSAGSNVPVKVGTRNDWKDVFCGDSNNASFAKALLLDNDGKLWKTAVWNGIFTEVTFPKKISKLVKGWGGHEPSVYGVIDVDGGLWFVGATHSHGMMGFGDTSDRAAFTKHEGEWTSVSTGLLHTLAIKTNGTLWSSGYNGQGQLGQDDTTNRNVFTQIGEATNWVKIFAVMYESFALNSAGELYAWGYNAGGTLGLNDKTQRNVPVKVGDYGLDTSIHGNSDTTYLVSGGAVYFAGNGTYTGISASNIFKSANISNCVLFATHGDSGIFAIVRRTV